jgi:hypothetical protein
MVIPFLYVSKMPFAVPPLCMTRRPTLLILSFCCPGGEGHRSLPEESVGADLSPVGRKSEPSGQPKSRYNQLREQLI